MMDGKKFVSQEEGKESCCRQTEVAGDCCGGTSAGANLFITIIVLIAVAIVAFSAGREIMQEDSKEAAKAPSVVADKDQASQNSGSDK